MTIQERRIREKSEVREKILDAARDLFVTYGYDGVTMRKVAARIDYSPTAIYLHFADKESLFREVCHQDFNRLAEAFRDLVNIKDPHERLAACGRAYVEFAVANPNHYRLMFMTSHPKSLKLTDEELARRGNPNEDAYAFLLGLVRDSLEAGAFRPELTDPHLIAQTLWAAVHGVASLDIVMDQDQWIDHRPLADRQRAMMDALMSGLMRSGA
jgi:AcrR family transcriptional regulator